MIKKILLFAVLAAALSGCAVYGAPGPYGRCGGPGYYGGCSYDGDYGHHMGCGHYGY